MGWGTCDPIQNLISTEIETFFIVLRLTIFFFFSMRLQRSRKRRKMGQTQCNYEGKYALDSGHIFLSFFLSCFLRLLFIYFYFYNLAWG